MIRLLAALTAATAPWTLAAAAPSTPPTSSPSGRTERQLPTKAWVEHQGYRFIGPALDALAPLVDEQHVRVETIGRSAGGLDILAYHIRPTGTPKRRVLIVAGIHALEWISTEVALDFLEELLRVPPPDVAVTVVPVLNPDGRARVEADLRAGRNQYRRGNGHNIDLNRDFAVNTKARAIWKAVIPSYYHHSKAPLSQPESQALDGLLARGHYDRFASLHAFGAYFYHPWSGRFERPEDWEEMLRVGRMMERAQGAHAYRTRELSHWGFFFRAQGTELDHAYGRYGTLSYLIELTRSGFDPLHPRRSLKTYFSWYNPKKVVRHRRKGIAALRALTFYR